MTNQEFSDQFDVFYNNITSNQAPGLDEYEKSVFLTRALDEIIKDYFTPGTNKLGAGFDDTERRQIDFSMLVNIVSYNYVRKTFKAERDAAYLDTIDISENIDTGVYISNSISGNENYTETKAYIVTVGPNTDPDSQEQLIEISIANDQDLYKSSENEDIIYICKESVWKPATEEDLHKEYMECSIEDLTAYKDTMFDFRANSIAVQLPSNIMMVINEQLKVTRKSSHSSTLPSKTVYLLVIPILYSEYTRLMTKPYKRPNHYLAWRLSNYSNDVDRGNFANLILGPNDIMDVYMLRYVRRPNAIILEDLEPNGVSLDGQTNYQECELDPILHHEILQRAVELAKLAWLDSTGQAVSTLATLYGVGQSGTPIGPSTVRQ